ncbi:MAG TPA: hypothetical protein VLH75_16445 [Longimicrobiales bacterium]|nr:hypothetical protein [Longimicrobiales bacterium]
MSLFFDRSKRAAGHLEWKVRLFVVGAGLGASGMYLEETWLTGAGIVVLLAGALLRLAPGGRGPTETEEDGDPGEAGGGRT